MMYVLDSTGEKLRYVLTRFRPSQELRSTASRVLIASACLPYPVELVQPLMEQFLTLLRTSTSWRTRLDVLLPLQSASRLAKASLRSR